MQSQLLMDNLSGVEYVETAVKLKYLFTAQYLDGTEFHQTSADTSFKIKGGSAFSDVDQNQVEKFYLDGSGRSYMVDLVRGIFDIDGVEFTVGDTGPGPYKLIFYRQHTHNFNIDREELGHIIKYCIGYTDAVGMEHKIYVS